MALGREVGDAYISVHGDLSDFRRDLDQAGGAAAEKAAMRAADDFSDAWAKRIKQDVDGKWDSILTAMYSNKAMDWDRLIGEFDSKNMDEAQSKILAFTDAMAKEGKLSTERQEQFNKALQGTADLMREQAKMDNLHGRALKENAMWEQRRADTMTEAAAENERWARTLDGMRKNNAIANMESDFRKLAETMSSMDMGKFADSFDSLHKARARIYEVTAAMQQQGRMSQEQADIMHANINQFIDDENAKSKAIKDALDETNRLREAQDRYNNSLNGMARTFHFGKMESDFRNLAAAMDSNDWSHFARGADDVEEMRNNIRRTADEMHRFGRMTDEEYAHIQDRVNHVTLALGENERAMGRNGNAAGRLRGILRGLGGALRGTREHLQGFAGLNVFGDMISSGLDFIHNLDRIALSASRTTLKLGSMGSVGGSALAGMFVIASDLGAVLGGLAAAAPAFLIGTAIGVSILAVALKDAKTVLADLKPLIKKFQDDISRDFWSKAKGPIEDMVRTLMPILDNPKGTSTAKSLGDMVGKLATAFKNIPRKSIETMFDRMNGAIDILGGAMSPLIKAFTTLGMVGSQYFKRFAQWIVDSSNNFNDFITKAAADGRLNKWIDTMIQGFKDMGRTIDGAFGIFNAISDAARRAGSGGLTEFADKLQAAARAMQSADFQNTLTTLFEGMNTATAKIGEALRGLGPAMMSVMPSIKEALIAVGDTAATIIGYIGEILSNPTVQKGITDFTNGMRTAAEILAPAIKPFADSIGNVLSLLGKVIESVAKIVTAFTINLGPVLDSMSGKMQTLLDPLSDMATNVIAKLKPVMEALDKYIVAPVAAALKSDLIPAVNDFVNEAGPVLEKLVKDFGPSFTILVKDTLPAMVRVAGELLEPMGKFIGFFTPTLAKTLEDVAKGFKSIESAIKLLKGEGTEEDTKQVFGAFDPEKVETRIKETEKKIKDASKMSWSDIFAEMMEGNAQEALGAAWTGKIWPEIEKAWKSVLDGHWGFTSNWDTFDPIAQWVEDTFGDGGSIGDWIEDANKNIREAMGKAGEAIGKAWDDTIGSFWDSIFGGKGASGSSSSGGGGAGGKGMSVGGKLDPKMFGLPDEEGTKTWFEDFGTWLGDGFTGAMGKLGEALGLSDFGTKWDEFWTGFGTVVSEAWTNITTWVSTKYTEISTGITEWITNFGTKWDEFWGGFGTAVSTAWDAIVLWISTKAAEIKTNVDNFITTVKTDWDNFWTGVNKKVTDTWTAVVLWITTKVTEIKTNITNFITAVKISWDTFWTGVNTKVTTIWTTITTWIATKVGEIKGNIDRFIGDVKTNWDNFWNTVKTKLDTAWTNMKSAVERKAGEIIEFVKGMPLKITNKFSNMWGEMERIGGSIWQGLKQGIENGIKWVEDAARNLARNAIAAAQLALEVNSPSKAFRRLGLSGGEGMAQGFDWSGKSVASASANMANLATEAFAHSKMFLAGSNAALGLASGLSSQKGVIADAFGEIAPGGLSANITTTGAGGAVAAGKVINVGGITIASPVTDPGITADKVLDKLFESSVL